MNPTTDPSKPRSQGHESTSHQAASLFAAVGPAFMKWMKAGVTTEGLTYPRLRLLHELSMDGPQIMSELGERLGVTARNVTVLVDGLERDGFAQRVPHPSDRRATLVELTQKGRRIVDSRYAAHHERAVALFEQMPEDDRTALLIGLQSLLDHLCRAGDAAGIPLGISDAASC